MSKLSRLVAIALVLLPVALAGQPGPPPDRRTGGRSQSEPPPPLDAAFFLGQAMRAINEKADLLLEQKQTDAAVDELRRVFAINVPKDRPVYELKARLIGRLAGLYAASGKKTEALDTLQRLLAELPAGSPAEAAAWLDAGTAYRSLGMADEALKAFDRAIELSNQLAKTGWQERRQPPRQGARDHPLDQPPG